MRSAKESLNGKPKAAIVVGAASGRDLHQRAMREEKESRRDAAPAERS
jgi:hypothetical protein